MHHKTVVISQSNYIPWKGYFSQILLADVFVFLDDVQYTKRDWRNRNLIKTASGLKWLTVPCIANRKSRICDVEILNNSWQEKHWKTIVHNYGKSKHFDEFKDFFEIVYTKMEWETLSELNQYLIKSLSNDIFGLDPIFLNSSQFPSNNKKALRILDLLDNIDGVTDYLTGESAKEYLIGFEDEFNKRKIKIHFMDYSGYTVYKQLSGEFIHEVSVLDLIFNTGFNAKKYLFNPFVKKYAKKNSI